jgi:predicted Rossmann-fold nucleotide-binding protein
MPVLLFSRKFWERIIDFKALVEEGVISEKDITIFQFVETAQEAWNIIEKANAI